MYGARACVVFGMGTLLFASCTRTYAPRDDIAAGSGGVNNQTSLDKAGEGGSRGGGDAAVGEGGSIIDEAEAGSNAGGLGTAGSAGSTPADPCFGKVCDSPPKSSCESGAAFKAYDSVGSCRHGECAYASRNIVCNCKVDICTTDPCSGITCASPPKAACKDPSTLMGYETSGTCTEGSCNYAPQEQTCEFGCENGACNADPCAEVSCNEPPAAKCRGESTRVTFAASGTCAAGECSYVSTDEVCASNQACSAGACSMCKSDKSCGESCGACAKDTPRCKDLTTSSQCVACLSNDDCRWPMSHCNTTTNACEPQPSCKGLAQTCGPAGNSDCCASNIVNGGSFNRGNNLAAPATLSTFRLDNFEITVGRFRRFVAAYSQTMIPAGAGKNPNNPYDSGWDPSWNTSLLPSTSSLVATLKCGAPYQSWKDVAGTPEEESLPLNCVTWFVAEAFCIWDGGRLPTEAEWLYAAAGGMAQRVNPWGADPPTCDHANFFGAHGCTAACTLPATSPVNRVGTESPLGDGLYGQSDLLGNLWEWTQDWYAPYSASCDDCANLAGGDNRIIHGGSFGSDLCALGVGTAYRYPREPSAGDYDAGARCARNP